MNTVSDYPNTVRARTASGELEWAIVKGLLAVPKVPSGTPLQNEILRIDPTTVICQQSQTKKNVKLDTKTVPVYQLGPNGPLGVPTGLVFLRFKSGESLQDHSAEIEQLGFQITRKSESTAAGWVRHQSGQCNQALTNARQLHDLEGVLVVEPQFLTSRQNRALRPRK